MRGGFEYYKSVPIDTEQNKEHAKTKLIMPVLGLGAQMWGGEAVLNSMKLVAIDDIGFLKSSQFIFLTSLLSSLARGDLEFQSTSTVGQGVGWLLLVLRLSITS
ncbi:MAG: hypothetical protein ACRD8Z_26425 [Nitrososphaeraceae archaeon]